MQTLLFETITPINSDLVKRFQARFKQESAQISAFDEFFYLLASLIDYNEGDFKVLAAEVCDIIGFQNAQEAELFANDYLTYYNSIIALIKSTRETLLKNGDELHGIASIHQLARALVALKMEEEDDLTEALIHHANLVVGTLFEKYCLELTEDFERFEQDLDKTFKDPAISDLLLFLLEMLFGMETGEIEATSEIAEEMVYAMIMVVTLAGDIGLAVEKELKKQ
ncbi:MAG: hypothetical protein K6347_06220 [Campylobacterales bacterium]